MILVVASAVGAFVTGFGAYIAGYVRGYRRCREDHDHFNRAWTGVVDELKQPVQQ